MATTWTCADAHTHEVATKGRDSQSAQGLGYECLSTGDRITGQSYACGAATAASVTREWTASTRIEAAAT